MNDTWTQAGVRCPDPSCRSTRVWGIGWGSRLIALYDAVDYENWECRDCGREWER